MHGIDPSPCSARFAAARGLAVDVGTFGHIPTGLGTFDGVCLTGVLEHLWDVDQAMGDVLMLLAPGGTVYVEVPDASRYLDPFIAPFEDFSSEHVNHFSCPSLAVLGSRFGLETVWSASVDEDLVEDFPVAVAATAWRRGRTATTPVARDVQLVRCLERFASRSASGWAEMDDALRRRLGDRQEFILWGMGELALKLLASSVLAERRPRALIDLNPARHGQRFGDLRVGPPGPIPPPDLPVVVGSLLRAEAIVGSIRTWGHEGEVIRLHGS